MALAANLNIIQADVCKFALKAKRNCTFSGIKNGLCGWCHDVVVWAITIIPLLATSGITPNAQHPAALQISQKILHRIGAHLAAIPEQQPLGPGPHEGVL